MVLRVFLVQTVHLDWPNGPFRPPDACTLFITARNFHITYPSLLTYNFERKIIFSGFIICILIARELFYCIHPFKRIHKKLSKGLIVFLHSKRKGFVFDGDYGSSNPRVLLDVFVWTFVEIFISFEYSFRPPTVFAQRGIISLIPLFVTTKFDVYGSCR